MTLVQQEQCMTSLREVVKVAKVVQDCMKFIIWDFVFVMLDTLGSKVPVEFVLKVQNMTRRYLIVWQIVDSIKFTITLQDYVNVTKRMGTIALMDFAKHVQQDRHITK